jgi:hypothetical protein
MKPLFFLLFTLFLTYTTYAQETVEEPKVNETPSQKRNISKTIETLKVAFITKELELSVEEAQNFWPVYNNFSEELKKARQSLKEDDIAFQEQKLVILKKYKNEFKRVLNSDDRVKKCFRAEPAFAKVLHKEWRRRLEARGIVGKKFAPPAKPNGETDHKPNINGGHKPGHPINKAMPRR